MSSINQPDLKINTSLLFLNFTFKNKLQAECPQGQQSRPPGLIPGDAGNLSSGLK